MAHPYHHAVSSVKKWGGQTKDYIDIHTWFDESKASFGDFRHRALRHHSEGIFECEKKFGIQLMITTGRIIPVRWVAEQHIIEDLGFIPTAAEWLKNIQPEGWMNRSRPLSRELENNV